MTASAQAGLTPEAVSRVLSDSFGDSLQDQSSFRGEWSSVIEKSALVAILEFLRDGQGFDHLSDITAVDYLGRRPRFDVVYHLFSYATHVWYRLKVRVEEGESVPTSVGVWPGANWAEREIWDLFGIVFEGHPDLCRIMLPEGWVGHPLRKDYPMSQIILPRSGATKMPAQEGTR